jgi:hypothetical protein
MEKLTFPQRVARMLAAAKALGDVLDVLIPAVKVVEEEADAMREAQERFAAKKAPKGGAINS